MIVFGTPEQQAGIEGYTSRELRRVFHSRWKLNELIHWDNSPPERAREYVAFAHERGVRVVWGFGWGWVPGWNFELPAEFDHGQGDGVELCASSEFNLQFFSREILQEGHSE